LKSHYEYILGQRLLKGSILLGFEPSTLRFPAKCPISDGSGSKFFDLVRVSFLWLGIGSGLGLNLENFPKKCQIFQFFSYPVKKNLFRLGQKESRSKAGQPLIYCGLKVSLGRVASGHFSSLHYYNKKARYREFNSIIFQILM